VQKVDDFTRACRIYRNRQKFDLTHGKDNFAKASKNLVTIDTENYFVESSK